MRTKKIGLANIHYFNNKPDNVYLDSAEQFLYDFFDKPQSQKESEIFDLLNSNPAWPISYHLSDQRRHLLDWYPFDSKKEILDIGAGCGALTGLFSDKLKKVAALELTPKRAEIIARRWADRDNVNVFVGSIEDKNHINEFDYVNVTGVFEYANRYTKIFKNSNFNEIPQQFIKKISTYVKNNGILLLAIENPIGIRYLSGAVEDHYAGNFIGVENYLTYNGIRTFSYTSIKKQITDGGFEVMDVYLPFPDYKLPNIVIHEKYLDNLNNASLSSLFLNQEHTSLPLHSFYSEIGFASHIRNENLLSKFANSFLIIAKKLPI